MKLLILSRSENTHADSIEKYCSHRVLTSRINFDLDMVEKERMPSIVVRDGAVDPPPGAVFVHHPRISYKQQWFADETERKLFVAVWDSVKEWLEALYPHARWVNRPSANHKSKNVLSQLEIAKRLGLKTPATLFTNCLEELKDFSDSTVVIKQGNLGVHLDGKRILTTIIDPSKLEEATLQGSPCFFQKYIPKRYELRVHVVGNSVLTCRIDSQVSARTKIDWRNYDLDNTPHSRHELDNATSEACKLLVREMGLEFGIIDMIVTLEGEHVFLECNAQGHWAWIEQLTGLPITRTLSKYLINGST